MHGQVSLAFRLRFAYGLLTVGYEATMNMTRISISSNSACRSHNAKASAPAALTEAALAAAALTAAALTVTAEAMPGI